MVIITTLFVESLGFSKVCARWVPRHTSIMTRGAITSFGWTTLPQPPYSLSDYHLFGAMKEALRGDYYGNDEEVKTVKNWRREQPAEFYEVEIHALIRRWNVALQRGGGYVER